MKYKQGQEVWVKGVVSEYGDVDFRDGKGSFIEYLHCGALGKLDIRTDDKVTIPKVVAKKIEYCKTEDYSLFHAMDYCFQYSDTADWLECNENIFTRAWFDGYQIEQEKLYIVEIPDPNSPHKYRCLRKGGNGVVIYTTNDDYWKNRGSHQLTEDEIKQDFEWAWDAGFAKEVE